jgi:DNA (cytosine-5)-methyltransferase 1
MPAQVVPPCVQPQRAHESQPRVADFCCGLGGLSLASRQIGMSVVAGVDSNATALKTFKRNFPEAEAIEGSVRSSVVLKRCKELLHPIDATGGFSVIISGPPCQGFSAAGSRDPVDLRNRVLVAVARAIVELQPDCALIENVAMVLAQKHAKRLRTFRATLADGGYFVRDVILNSAEFGVAQKRQRAFFLVSQCELNEGDFLSRLARLKKPEVTVREALAHLPRATVRPDDYDDETECIGISNHLAMRHSKRVMNKIAALDPGKGPMSYRRLHPDRPAKTLFSGHRAPPAHFSEPRSITVREAARLQGFPDTFRIYGSFANQMEQMTNAVPPPVASVVLRVLADMVGIPTRDHA